MILLLVAAAVAFVGGFGIGRYFRLVRSCETEVTIACADHGFRCPINGTYECAHDEIAWLDAAEGP